MVADIFTQQPHSKTCQKVKLILWKCCFHFRYYWKFFHNKWRVQIYFWRCSTSYCKFESHPSISLIKNKSSNGNNVKFTTLSLRDIEFEIRLLNPKKKTTHNNIPRKIIKSSSETTVNGFHWPFNEKITKGAFPPKLKLADFTPVAIKKRWSFR